MLSAFEGLKLVSSLLDEATVFQAIRYIICIAVDESMHTWLPTCSETFFAIILANCCVL